MRKTMLAVVQKGEKEPLRNQKRFTDGKTADNLSSRMFLTIRKPLWSPVKTQTTAMVVQLGQARNSWLDHPKTEQECAFVMREEKFKVRN